jgi:hypothetical protein
LKENAIGFLHIATNILACIILVCEHK